VPGQVIEGHGLPGALLGRPQLVLTERIILIRPGGGLLS